MSDISILFIFLVFFAEVVPVPYQNKWSYTCEPFSQGQGWSVIKEHMVSDREAVVEMQQQL